MKLHTISLLLLGLLFGSLSIHQAAAQNHALNFNGTNNFVTFPYSPALDLVDGTIEFWMRPDWVAGVPTQNPCILAYRTAMGTRFSLHVQADLSGVGIWNGISYQVRPFPFVQGTWYHVALVESGTSTTFYVNGVSIGATANGFNTSVVNAPLTVGWSNVPSQTQEYFRGDIDEVRIWNTLRTPAEISANRNTEINPQQTGLVAYYRFNQGAAGGNNTGVNRLIDLAACTTGTLNNFALAGAASNWVSASNGISLVAPFGGNNTLNFNGTNNFVTFPYSPALDLVDGTIEFWMRPNWAPGSNGQNPCVLGYRAGFAATRFSVHVEDNLSGIGIWNGISYQVRPFPFVQGTWYHIAVVESGTSTTFYVNGVSIGATANGFNTAVSNAPLTIGWSNDPLYPNEYFRGEIDEMRIWNTVRTPAQITANLNSEINLPQAGLVAYYRFNQGVAGASNAAFNTLNDLASCNIGTLNNFTLSGNTSNWIASTQPLCAGSSIEVATVAARGNGNLISNGSTAFSTANFTDMGTVALGNAITRSFNISNTGTATLTVNNITFTGANAADFTLLAPPAFPVNIAPGTSLSVDVRAQPTVGSLTSTATLNIANNSCISTFAFDLRAAATPSGAVSMNRLAGTNADLGSPIPLRIDREVTIEAWVNPNNPAIGSGAINTLIANKLTGAGNDGFAFYINSLSNTANDNRLVFESKGKSVHTLPNTINPNVWQHVAVTVNATTQTVNFYINGVLQTNDAANPDNGVVLSEVANNLRIGAFADLAYPFTGAMDEVRLWNRVLSQAEITANFNRILTGQECNLMAYWNFDEASGSAINDATIAANHGMLAGGFARVPSGADIRGFAAAPAACTTTWNGTAWTNGRPTANTEAIIAGNYNTQMQGNLLTNQLTVNAAANLTIHAQGRVVATGAITNNGAIDNCAAGMLTFGSFAGNPVPPAATQPTVPASDMTVTTTTTTSLSLSWTNGNGQKRLVVLRPNTAVAGNAAFDNVAYVANANFTLADTINNGTGRVVFNGTGNSVVVTNLMPNTNYHIAVFEYNETPCGVNYGNAGAVFQRMTLPNAPVALPAEPITPQGFTARWQSAGTVNYLLEVSVRDDFSSIAFSGQVSGFALALNNIAQTNFSRVFFYRLRAINASGMSAFSNTVRVLLQPATPVALPAAEITSNSFQARWNFTPGAERYEVEVARDSAFTQIVRRLATTAIQINVTGLDENTAYFYRVRGAFGTLFSDYSNIISLRTLLKAPVALEATAVAPERFTARWQPYPIAAASIEVEIARDDKFSDILRRARVSNQDSLPISGLPLAPVYFYRLRAFAGSVFSEYSNVITVEVVPPAPVAIDPAEVNINGFTARWRSVRGADAYRFDVARDSAFSNMIQADVLVNGLEQLVSVNNPALTYFYRVRAENMRGVSANSNVIAVFLPPAVPLALRRENSNNPLEIVLAWNASPSARQPVTYMVELATNSNFSNAQSLRTGDLRAVFNGQAGQRYFVRVKALHDRGESAYSSAISFVLPPAVPSGISLNDVTESSFMISWQSVQGALSYRVEVNGNVRTVQGTSTEVTGLQSLQRHTLRISATNEGGNSEWSDAVHTITLPLPVTVNPSSNVEPRRFTAAWSASAQSNTYLLEVSGNEGFTSLLAGFPQTINNATEAIINLPVPGGVYFYRVRVSATIAGQTLLSRPSLPQRVSILGTPAGLKTENITATGFDLLWNAVADAQGYEVQLSLNNFSTILRETSVIGTSVSWSSLEANREYQVRVRAFAPPRSVSEWGEIRQFTLPPVPHEAFLRRISTRRATEIGWSYDRLPFERVSNLRFIVERSDNVGVPFRVVSNEIILPASRQFVFEDITGTQRLQASYRLRITNAAGTVFYDMGQRIVTSLEEEEATPAIVGLQVYPNPAREILHIRSDKPLRNIDVQIADAKGAIVYSGQLKTVDMSGQLSVAHLSAGIYLLQVVSDTETRVFKWVKE